EYIAEEVEIAWSFEEYGPPPEEGVKEDVTLLVPHVNKTVDYILTRWVRAPDWNEELGKSSKGENARDRAEWEYVKGYKKDYRKRWLAEHQRIANERLANMIRRGEELDPDFSGDEGYDAGL
ncbi:MAG: hypothetical protein Q9184_007082, partial [Pyrenodesmia sp. 2 TL-2023]